MCPLGLAQETVMPSLHIGVGRLVTDDASSNCFLFRLVENFSWSMIVRPLKNLKSFSICCRGIFW